MSHQEMQFADPDWQPASPLSSRSPGEQARAVPTEIVYAPSVNSQADEQSHSPVQHTSRRQRWLLGLLARVAVAVIWATTPLVTRAFHGGWIVPLLGLLLLPVTVLTYTIVFALAGSVTGLGWLWVVGALLLDLASHVGQPHKRSSGKPRRTSHNPHDHNA